MACPGRNFCGGVGLEKAERGGGPASRSVCSQVVARDAKDIIRGGKSGGGPPCKFLFRSVPSRCSQSPLRVALRVALGVAWFGLSLGCFADLVSPWNVECSVRLL